MSRLNSDTPDLLYMVRRNDSGWNEVCEADPSNRIPNRVIAWVEDDWVAEELCRCLYRRVKQTPPDEDGFVESHRQCFGVPPTVLRGWSIGRNGTKGLPE